MSLISQEIEEKKYSCKKMDKLHFTSLYFTFNLTLPSDLLIVLVNPLDFESNWNWAHLYNLVSKTNKD